MKQIRPFTLDHAWLALGIIFIVINIGPLLNGHLEALLGIAVGSLVAYSSTRNLGGWRNIL